MLRTFFFYSESLSNWIKNNTGLLKVIIAFTLLSVIVFKNKISSDFLLELLWQPEFCLLMLFGNLFIATLGCLRWKILTKRYAAVNISLWKLFRYSMASQFVGLGFLGTFGTDAARSFYLNSHENIDLKSAVKALTMDRIAAALALLLLAVPAWSYMEFALSTSVVISLCLLSLSFLRIEILLSAIMHFTKLFLICVILFLNNESLEYIQSILSNLAAGIVLESIPISWQGMGLGHVAFEMLLEKSGADIYNSYFLAKTAFKLCGVFFFLRLKKTKADSQS